MIICINGMPRSGKDTFANFCVEQNKEIIDQISTVDFVKDVAKYCGWNGDKTPENRKFLSDLKQLLIDWNDVPYNKVMLYYSVKEAMISGRTKLGDKEKEPILFVHVREPEEIKKFVDRNNAKTLLIRNNRVENLEQSNDSDKNVLNYKYDYIIENNGTLDELRDKAKQFIDLINKKVIMK